MAWNDQPDTEKPERRGGPRRFKKDAAERLGLSKAADEGAKRTAIVRQIAGEMYDVSIDGHSERRSTTELMLIKLRNLASEGNPRASKAYVKYANAYAPQVAHENAEYLIAPSEKTPQQWAAAVEKHNRKADARRAEELRQKELQHEEQRQNETRPPKQL